MIFAFLGYELDVERFELRRSGCVVELQPKVLDLLLFLVRNRERVVPKEELLAAIWPDAVVTDSSLTRAVSLARLGIGDRGPEPAVIVNVPRRGYRFLAPVQTLPGPDAEAPASGYVGRTRLLARLAESLDAALSGRGRILLLAGQAGIGKTRTAELLTERARTRGAEVATSWGQEEGAPTYWAWMRLLRALAGAAPHALAALPPGQCSDLTPLVPEAGGARGARTPTPGTGEVGRFRLFEAVQAFLARVATRRPLALFLDDLHVADSESLGLLEFIGQSIGSLPIAIITSCREEEAGRTPLTARALERLLRVTALERWPLAGLPSEEIRAFVRPILDRDPEPALLGALERQTSGNPLLLGESLRSLDARGLLAESRTSAAWEALLPSGIRHLLQPKLRGLTPDALEALGCAAAFGLEVERGLLTRCLGDTEDLDSRLREAEQASLLLAVAGASRLRFPHALVREALYAELVPPGDGRRALHARIAAALEEGKESACDEALAAHAHHACEAVPLLAAGRAIALCEAAGEQAARLHDFERAAAWYQRALAVLDRNDSVEPATRTALLLGLGAAQTHSGGPELARVSFRQAADGARSLGRLDLFVAAALGFAHRPITSGHADADLVALLEEALQRAPAVPEPLRVRVLSRLAAELRYAEPARADALMTEALAKARRLGEPAVLAQTLDDCSFVRSSLADPEGWIAINEEIVRAAHAANDLDLALLGQKGRVTGFLELGDVAAVDREIRACEGTANALRTPYARWLCAALRAMRALLAGELEAAEQAVAESGALGERVDSRDVALELLVQLAYLRVEQGRGAEIEAVARAQVQRFPDAPAWRAALARILVATEQPAEARRELEPLVRRRFADVPHDRGWLPTLSFAAEVAFATRDESAAAHLEALLEPYARLGVVAGSGLLYYGPVSHHLGLLCAAASRWDAAIAHFEAAFASEERAGARVWEARSRVACGRALHFRGATGDRGRALRLANEASEAASRHGWAAVAAEARELQASSWSSRASPRPRRPGRRAHAPES